MCLFAAKISTSVKDQPERERKTCTHSLIFCTANNENSQHRNTKVRVKEFNTTWNFRYFCQTFFSNWLRPLHGIAVIAFLPFWSYVFFSPWWFVRNWCMSAFILTRILNLYKSHFTHQTPKLTQNPICAGISIEIAHFICFAVLFIENVYLIQCNWMYLVKMRFPCSRPNKKTFTKNLGVLPCALLHLKTHCECVSRWVCVESTKRYFILLYVCGTLIAIWFYSVYKYCQSANRNETQFIWNVINFISMYKLYTKCTCTSSTTWHIILTLFYWHGVCRHSVKDSNSRQRRNRVTSVS